MIRTNLLNSGRLRHLLRWLSIRLLVSRNHKSSSDFRLFSPVHWTANVYLPVRFSIILHLILFLEVIVENVRQKKGQEGDISRGTMDQADSEEDVPQGPAIPRNKRLKTGHLHLLNDRKLIVILERSQLETVKVRLV